MVKEWELHFVPVEREMGLEPATTCLEGIADKRLRWKCI